MSIRILTALALVLAIGVFPAQAQTAKSTKKKAEPAPVETVKKQPNSLFGAIAAAQEEAAAKEAAEKAAAETATKKGKKKTAAKKPAEKKASTKVATSKSKNTKAAKAEETVAEAKPINSLFALLNASATAKEDQAKATAAPTAKQSKAEAKKAAAEKLAIEKKAAAEKVAADKKAAAEKLAAEKDAAAKKLAADKLAAEKLAAAKAAEEKRRQEMFTVDGEKKAAKVPFMFGMFDAKKPEATVLDEVQVENDQIALAKLEKNPPKIDDRFKKVTVAFSGYDPGTIVVDTQKKFLYFVESPIAATRYGVAVGKEGLLFTGETVVGAKQVWPKWTPTPEMIERDPKAYAQYSDGMEGGPENPLGARAIYLYQGKQDTYLRIHGTNAPNTIGSASSNGCFRMLNQDVMDLYDRVKQGARVVVL